MEFLSSIIAHSKEILIVAGLTISLFSGLCFIAWLCGFMIRARHYALSWRLNAMKQKQAAQIIRLDMAARERAHKQSGSYDELHRLRKEAEVAAREIADLRKLHSAQDETLAARALFAERQQAKIEDLEQAHEEADEANHEQEVRIEHAERAKEAAEKAVADLVMVRDQLQEDLLQREQLVRMLESQVGTHQEAAKMANASTQDHQREIEKLRREVHALTQNNELLARLANRGGETSTLHAA